MAKDNLDQSKFPTCSPQRHVEKLKSSSGVCVPPRHIERSLLQLAHRNAYPIIRLQEVVSSCSVACSAKRIVSTLS